MQASICQAESNVRGQDRDDAINNHIATVTCLGALAADLDGDCAVGPGDLEIQHSAWGTSGPGDLNGSGEVDAEDLGMLLAAWTWMW